MDAIIISLFPNGVVVDPNEGGPNFVNYGPLEYFPGVGSLPAYRLPFENLRGCTSHSFKKVGENVEARRPLSGRYELRRTDGSQVTAEIPLEESRLIRQHLAQAVAA